MQSARRVTVVSENLARRFFAGEDPIGKQIKFKVFDEIPETRTTPISRSWAWSTTPRGIDLNDNYPGFRIPQGPRPGIRAVFFSGFGDRSIAMLTRVRRT